MFTSWFHDNRLRFNGVEWTVIYYWRDIENYLLSEQNASKDLNMKRKNLSSDQKSNFDFN